MIREEGFRKRRNPSFPFPYSYCSIGSRNDLGFASLSFGKFSGEFPEHCFTDTDLIGDEAEYNTRFSVNKKGTRRIRLPLGVVRRRPPQFVLPV